MSSEWIKLTKKPSSANNEIMDTDSKQSVSIIDFAEIEEDFQSLLKLENLDLAIAERPDRVEDLERTVENAIQEAYEEEASCDEAHLFLQRVLYQIFRMKLFWYDDFDNYKNEDSAYLFLLRAKIEGAWQQWETRQLDLASFKRGSIEEELRTRVAKDLNPAPTATERYISDEISEAGYRRLLAIASVNGLVEASQLSRMLGGVGNEVQSMLTKIFLEEYGGGKLARKHSTFFIEMLDSLGMQTQAEAYLDLLPWPTLANINHSFTLSEKKRCYLRYVGGLLFTEVTTPAAFKNYKLAGERIGLNEDSYGYWDLHMKEDERHGQWMLDDVALPLTAQYPEQAWEILMGYEQQRFMNQRAAKAVDESLREAEEG